MGPPVSRRERDKGAGFEREIATLLSDHLGRCVRRNLAQSRGGKQEGGDLVAGNFSFECKRRASLAFYNWLEQATEDAGPDRVPVVIVRADRKQPVAILALADLMPLLSGEILSDEGSTS